MPVHLGRQHSCDASGKRTGVSPKEQPEPLLPGLAQWLDTSSDLITGGVETTECWALVVQRHRFETA